MASTVPDSTAPLSSQQEEVLDPNDPIDLNIPDNYVSHTLKTTKALPPVTRKNWYLNLNYFNLIMLAGLPLLSLIGFWVIPIQKKTFWFSVLYYYITGLGITAGYHRLWAHRSYNASRLLEYFLAMAGAGAVEGSIHWWARAHRAHHRYTDTDLDPYGAHHGLLWSHIGWMVVKGRRRSGLADISDFRNNEVVQWQHRWRLPLMFGMGFGVPTLVPGLLWGDWKGGFFFAGVARLTFVHHSTFCVNSLAHWLGETPFDDKHTPRDHIITALVTIGEGYHNFHHQFPMDFRNAIRWYQYDPTKWFISTMQFLGLASHLKKFPDNEVRKGELTMQLKKLRQKQDSLHWPQDSNELPVILWKSFQEQAQTRPLVLISGFIHDVSGFMDEHPGGRHLLGKHIGKDATTAFFGGVYDHSNAAHNLLAMKRVGILAGGTQLAICTDAETFNRAIPPSQKLRVYRAALEQALRFSKFTSDDAFEPKARRKMGGKELVISISTFTGRTLFSCALRNDAEIVEAKKRIVARFNHSSFYVGRKLAAEGTTPEQARLPFPEFAPHGGAFPVWIQGAPIAPVAVIIISGLPPEEDHQLVVDSLTDIIPKLAISTVP